MKKAFAPGMTGQDGSYLAEFLLEKGCEVQGIKRRASLFNTQRFKLQYGDLTDTSNLTCARSMRWPRSMPIEAR